MTWKQVLPWIDPSTKKPLVVSWVLDEDLFRDIMGDLYVEQLSALRAEFPLWRFHSDDYSCSCGFPLVFSPTCPLCGKTTEKFLGRRLTPTDIVFSGALLFKIDPNQYLIRRIKKDLPKSNLCKGTTNRLKALFAKNKEGELFYRAFLTVENKGGPLLSFCISYYLLDYFLLPVELHPHPDAYEGMQHKLETRAFNRYPFPPQSVFAHPTGSYKLCLYAGRSTEKEYNIRESILGRIYPMLMIEISLMEIFLSGHWDSLIALLKKHKTTLHHFYNRLGKDPELNAAWMSLLKKIQQSPV